MSIYCSSPDEKDSPIDADDSGLPHKISKQRHRHGGHYSRRPRSLYGKNPFAMFGPKAQLHEDTTLTIHDPTSQRLTWLSNPHTILIIKKLDDSTVTKFFKMIAQHLIMDCKVTVLVEESLMEDQSLQNDEEFLAVLKPYLRIFSIQTCLEGVDLIITLGGDGTLIHASSLFQQSVPPLMAFNMGSLGFLTPFTVDDFKDSIRSVFNGNSNLLLRSRLKCVVCRKQDSGTLSRVQDLETETLFPCLDSLYVTHNVLNDVVFDRGPSPYLSNINLYVEGRRVTSVQGDGLIISTPTGSTAYAAAAGSSMMHPSVPAVLITPICPHSLSFRPIILPAGVEITVTLSTDARNTAWASFDGRSREEIRFGDSVRITTSIYPLPALCADDQLYDWFGSLGQCLNWNERRSQKCLSTTPLKCTELSGSGTN